MASPCPVSKVASHTFPRNEWSIPGPGTRRINVRPFLRLALIGVMSLTLTGCGGCGGQRLNGGGSSFIAPLFEEQWTKDYFTKTKMKVDYVSQGSSAGINNMTNNNLDFAASDYPMSPDEIKNAGGEDAIIHVPLVMGPVAIIYNLEGISDLKLTGKILAKIYLGENTTWNHDEIKAE